MRVLVAPNAFKGSLTVLAAARAFSRGARSAQPRANVDLMPIADGGDGVMDCLLAAKGGRRVYATVRGPLGRPTRAPLALLSDGSACVELARASGLALLAGAPPRVMSATSYGTGELIAAALSRGARRVIVGLGGSASSDGGAGLAQALGARLLDEAGRELGPGAAQLSSLSYVDAEALRRRLAGVEILAVTDVDNPLLGPLGSARVYGPQKGASPAQVAALERALKRYAGILRRDLGVSVAYSPGAGAAGGCGAGLLAFLRARVVRGAAFVLKACEAERRVARADLVLTGEGRLDRTSFYGKAPIELARLARRLGTPVAMVCGSIEPSCRPRLARLGVRRAVALSEAGATPEGSLRDAARWAARAAALACSG